MNYVKIEEGVVTQSIIADAEYFKTFIDTSPGDWITVDSADGIVGVGSTYNATAKKWLSPQPYPSWKLDSSWEWQPPQPRPAYDVNSQLAWDEDSFAWK